MRTAEALIDFAGDVRRLTEDDQLLFGRGEGADLDIDDNPLLHRRFGRIWHRDGNWWLRNEGSTLPLSVHDRASTTSFTLAPGAEVSLTFTEASIRFSAGVTSYEISIDLIDARTAELPHIDCDLEIGPETVDQSKGVVVVGAQRLLLVALAEQKLRNPHEPLILPSNKSIWFRLGWNQKQFDRKLDRLCKKFHDAGVRGLRGDLGQHASERRRVLVEHTVKHGVIAASDLVLLDDYPR